MKNLFLVKGRGEHMLGIGTFPEGLSQNFAGIRIDDLGVVIYFQFDSSEPVDKLLRHADLCERAIVDAGFTGERVQFEIIKGSTGPFQMAYRIQKVT